MCMSDEKQDTLSKFLDTLSVEQLVMLHKVVDYEFLDQRNSIKEEIFFAFLEVFGD